MKTKKSKAKKRGRKKSATGIPSLSRKAAAATKNFRGVRNSKRHPKTALPSLITHGIVLEGAKVEYLSKKDRNHSMGVGEITCSGIKCRCCDEVYGLTAFEAHCGSTYHRPAENLFLEGGKSLMECQLQMMLSKENDGLKGAKGSSPCDKNSVKSKSYPENDSTCAICHYEGDLILCDECPCSFHKSCIGLKDTPEGDWFCPWCCCTKCGKKESFCNHGDNGETNGGKNDPDLRCYQCERRYHSDCLQIKESSEKSPAKKWFCSKTCQEIFSGLSSYLGKSVSVSVCELGIQGLTWTLLRSPTFFKDGEDSTDTKLKSALEVMHECFEPIKNARTGKDVAEDVIFSRGSVFEAGLNNFQGFYTAIVEKDGELVTAAAFRVLGEEVAELPLICTRFQYRGLGMCKLLMNDLEKMLADLGVQRLILPAASSVVSAWTSSSFGFSKMAESERLELLDYTFLDFRDTIMCQKFLGKTKCIS